MSRKRNQKKKKAQKHSQIGCIITILVLIPVFYGLYLYFQQSETLPSFPDKTVKIPATSIRQPIPTAEELTIPRMIIPRKEQIIHHTGYSVSYNENLRLPNWVAYELTRQETQGNAKRTDRFITDPSVKGIIATNADYARSGYDKGHMAPAADMKWSNTAMKESFYFSNMCPQHPELNRRKWKDLEEKIRDWAITDSAIIIICGPIIEKTPQKIGKNKVTVPQKFFKVILSPFTTSPNAIGFLFKNGRSVSPLATYAVSVDSIETLTGMDFFAPLPDDLENKIESQVNCDQWGL